MAQKITNRLQLPPQARARLRRFVAARDRARFAQFAPEPRPVIKSGFITLLLKTTRAMIGERLRGLIAAT